MLTARFMIDCMQTSGLGHLRRSLVLASGLRALGVDCKITLTSSIGEMLVQRHNFECSLNVNEAAEKVNILVVDGNCFTPQQIEYHAARADFLCVLDDNALRPLKADVIINPNLYAEKVDYSNYEFKTIFCGPEYHLVAEYFLNERKNKQKKIDYIVCFGGTDKGVLAEPVIEQLLTMKDKKICWAIPGHIKAPPSIIELEFQNKNFFIEVDGDVAKLLADSRCYIGGAGTMVLEAIASGCSIVTCAVVPDQFRNVAYLKQKRMQAFERFDASLLAEVAMQGLSEHKPVSLCSDGRMKIARGLMNTYKTIRREKEEVLAGV